MPLSFRIAPQPDFQTLRMRLVFRFGILVVVAMLADPVGSPSARIIKAPAVSIKAGRALNVWGTSPHPVDWH